MKRTEIGVSWGLPKVEPSSKAPINVTSNKEPFQGSSGRRTLLSHPLPHSLSTPWHRIGFQHCARLANACTVRQTATTRAQAINPLFPYKYHWGERQSHCKAVLLLPWKQFPTGQTTIVMGRVIGYEVTLTHLTFTSFHLTAGPLIVARRGLHTSHYR